MATETTDKRFDEVVDRIAICLAVAERAQRRLRDEPSDVVTAAIAAWLLEHQSALPMEQTVTTEPNWSRPSLEKTIERLVEAGWLRRKGVSSDSER